MPGKIRPIMVKGHTRPLTMVKYNREGDLLVTAAKDHRPCMWYADNGERIGTFDGHNGTVWAVDFNCARLARPTPPEKNSASHPPRARPRSARVVVPERRSTRRRSR